jgi:hypothetical protein
MLVREKDHRVPFDSYKESNIWVHLLAYEAWVQ